MPRMFVPELSHVENFKIPLFVTTENRCGAVFQIPLIDLEGSEVAQKISAIERIFGNLPSGVTLRLSSYCSASQEMGDAGFRTASLKDIGYLEQQLLLSFEFERSMALSRLLRVRSSLSIRNFAESLPQGELEQLGGRVLSKEELKRLFSLPTSSVVAKKKHLDFGSELVGMVRVWKPGNQIISEETLAGIKDQLPLPYSICVTAKRVPQHLSELKIRGQWTKQAHSTDPLASERQAELERSLTQTTLESNSVFAVEWLILMERYSEESLRRDLAKAISALSSFGEAMVETVGGAPSYRASRLGSKQHHTFFEHSKSVSVYLPIFSFGGNRKVDETKGKLWLHRLDGSLHGYDQFDPGYLAYNAIITGKSGSGKSVLANCLSRSLLEDSRVRMVKIDVGGSYKKECELFGGTQTDFALEKPSGMNPFASLSALKLDNAAIQVVSQFVSCLILEEEERAISRSLQVEIDEQVKAYAKSCPEKPCIDDFYRFCADFPRKRLLSRWCEGGVFENAFKVAPDDREKPTSRYRYYNFESIQSAGAPAYAEGIMAAVIAEVNLEMLLLSKRNNGERLVLFCDETKFFIERNAAFFLLTTANFRKFGHSVILVAQKIKDFELSLENGKTDLGIIVNSPIRFLLEQDVEREYLKERFHLGDRHITALLENPYRGKEYREFVLQDDTGTRLVRLYLSPEEYWSVTSTREDNEKIENLRKAVPNLALKEAIACLAIGDHMQTQSA